MGEKEVIRLIQERNPQGVDQLLLHFGALMRYIIAPILPDSRDREECLSDTAMRVWDRIGQFDPEKGSWTGWLTALTRNMALNRARGQRDPEHTLTEDLPAQSPGPEEAVLRQERLEDLQTLLRRLSAKEQALLYRKYYYMQSTAQIARELGTTPRAVEGQLYRLKKRLRARLGGEAHG